MTINLTETSLYVGCIVVLIGIQIYQQRRIIRFQRELEDIWEQMAALTSNFVSKLLENVRNSKENNQ